GGDRQHYRDNGSDDHGPIIDLPPPTVLHTAFFGHHSDRSDYKSCKSGSNVNDANNLMCDFHMLYNCLCDEIENVCSLLALHHGFQPVNVRFECFTPFASE